MLKEFISSFKSCVLSTIDEKGNPFTSYAPFIIKDGKYYVYISSMAKHTQNLDLHKKVALFFVEDEISCENIFGRKRVVLQCNSKKLQRDTESFEELVNIFEEKHGSTMKMLKSMKDFSFYEFEVFDGEAVFGFGEAYNVGGKNFDELVERKGLSGHKK
ncbi:HugZ family protein [Arcobacter arenosus]|uniref:Heme iron utilization protein n=1 Tax=Arcobacter arenosus TaxID=2576037 RepID=A0A5R8Y0F4_9BACT|nr:pyridoxamine 5'-phosphate oxidase family protein [Arcobacter arenosus]TLP37553.1 heme iron utilization protein [Arcobacter arenosus]